VVVESVLSSLLQLLAVQFGTLGSWFSKFWLIVKMIRGKRKFSTSYDNVIPTSYDETVMYLFTPIYFSYELWLIRILINLHFRGPAYYY
jgi:hypothetical protein